MPGFVSAAVTHVGLVRPRNEDAYLDRPDLGVWAVADGMGGHEAGDLASARIVAALGEIRPPGDLAGFANLVRVTLTNVDRELRARAALLGSGAVIGSTVVTLLSAGPRVGCVWAGDSRLYLRRGGVVGQLTSDHSAVQQLIDRGVLHEADAERHPDAHIVTQAIGAGRLDFGWVEAEVAAGDVFLLCSDGLSRVVAREELAGALAAPPREACAALLDTVLARGAPDNVTLVVVRAPPTP